ncbi:MAG TPA: hypothetical protein VHA35_24525, partial [Dongiaceae bacterium]|nr:hypothetical protein [Dongiaceae bacterium]
AICRCRQQWNINSLDNISADRNDQFPVIGFIIVGTPRDAKASHGARYLYFLETSERKLGTSCAYASEPACALTNAACR